MIEICGYLINKRNITCVHINIFEKSYRICIRFNSDNDYILQLETRNKEEFDKWLEKLK